ncbi:hypothetical protein SNEBB_002821 [Seison nebaliae]|nr:hypothetical protein SNEBB_002821 [Seison nebaliae]
MPINKSTTVDFHNPLVILAKENWWNVETISQYDEDLVSEILLKHLRSSNATNQLILLQSRYLQNYLWKYFEKGEDFNEKHFISIIILVNKQIEHNDDNSSNLWRHLTKKNEVFEHFYSITMKHLYERLEGESIDELNDDDIEIMKFIYNSLNGMEVPLLSKCIMKYFGLLLWNHLDVDLRSSIFNEIIQFKKFWKIASKRKKSSVQEIQMNLLFYLTKKFLQILYTSSKLHFYQHQFLHLTLKILTESITLPKTRRFCWQLFHNNYLLPIILRSPYLKRLMNDERKKETENDSKQELTASILLDKLLNVFDDSMKTTSTITENEPGEIDEKMEKEEKFDRTINDDIFMILLNQLMNYYHYDIDNISLKSLNQFEIRENYQNKISSFQFAVFKLNDPTVPKIGTIRELTMMNVSYVSTRIRTFLTFLEEDDLEKILKELKLFNGEIIEFFSKQLDCDCSIKELFIDILELYLQPNTSQIERINRLSLYPTEELIWNDNIVPADRHDLSTNIAALTLPKLNLQYLSLTDYLQRNFELFRIESTYQIRQDIERVIRSMKPVHPIDYNPLINDDLIHMICRGTSRMGGQIQSLNICTVAEPLVGEYIPSKVLVDIRLDLGSKENAFLWQSTIRRHDVGFLIACRPTQSFNNYDFKTTVNFFDQVEIISVRGCQVRGIVDLSGLIVDDMKLIELNKKGMDMNDDDDGDGDDKRNDNRIIKLPKTNERTWRVSLDSNQYHIDSNGEKEIYQHFNIFIRRNAKENNFKAVLETIRQLMRPLINAGTFGPNELEVEKTKLLETAVPDWLGHLLLGVERPDIATPDVSEWNMNWNDTFIDIDHIQQSFPSFNIEIRNEKEFKDIDSNLIRYHLKKVNNERIEVTLRRTEEYYLKKKDENLRNHIRFTPKQIEAIESGMSLGLTMVVGPPGAGKTDVVVQLINNLYNNKPNERILIVTHSNQALNQVFDKLIRLDINERHLIRLGHGEQELDTEKDFSRYGRVNFALSDRQRLLKEVNRLHLSLIPKDVIVDNYEQSLYTCETAQYFFLQTILRKWETFLLKFRNERTIELIIKDFPFYEFTKFNENDLLEKILDENHEMMKAEKYPLKLKEETYERILKKLRKIFKEIEEIFNILEEYRPLEMLRYGNDRSNYLLLREAKIVALTCTHAALKRKELLDNGFTYDTIIMEESAQILEIETFIPLVLQNPKDGRNRLKRWIMIGDHNQLPPIIQNIAIQKVSNFEQSLFKRFIQLNVPHIILDAQGRAKEELARLFSWNYDCLNNLPHTTKGEFSKKNIGFKFDYQLIDVELFEGRIGESEPIPHFIQNLGEAEFCVALFMYMRLRGYDGKRITILTMYNGQKCLIEDILKKRCYNNEVFGKPYCVSTVDKYQGQENDYIILSMVRTKYIGYLRDLRRIVVAMSRARFGFYVFAHLPLLRTCYELSEPLKLFKLNNHKLVLNMKESREDESIDVDDESSIIRVNDVHHLHRIVEMIYNRLNQSK